MKLLRTAGAIAMVAVVAALPAMAEVQSSNPASTSQPAKPAPHAPAKSRRPSPKSQGAAKRAQADPAGAAHATKAFLDRMREYVTFHNSVQKMVPPLTETGDPAKLSAREKALGEQMMKSRPEAKEGDFLIKEYRPYLIQIIKEDFAKRAPADRKALLIELPKGVKVGVNQVYPTELPLATFPGNLLKKLPQLPEELEYRIVGRDLVLRDTKANVVVDILRNVFPI